MFEVKKPTAVAIIEEVKAKDPYSSNSISKGTLGVSGAQFRDILKII